MGNRDFVYTLHRQSSKTETTQDTGIFRPLKRISVKLLGWVNASMLSGGHGSNMCEKLSRSHRPVPDDEYARRNMPS